MSMVRVSSYASSRASDGPSEGYGPRIACALAFAVAAFLLAFVGKALLPIVNDGDDLAMVLGGWALGGLHAGWVIRRGLGEPGAPGALRAVLTTAFGLAMCVVAPTLITGFWIWQAGAGLIFTGGISMVGENPASLIAPALIDGFKLAIAPILILPYAAPLVLGGALAGVLHLVLQPREG